MTRSLKKLIEVFSKTEIYPRDCFTHEVPFNLMKNLHPNDSYFKDAEELIKIQPDESSRIGADLPYWGAGYFGDSDHKRTMIVAQDSLTRDAGSVVFYAPLLKYNYDKATYDAYLNKTNQKTFNHSSYRQVLQCFLDWGIDLNYVYLTDAKKVYFLHSRFNENRNFDIEASENLLREEIKAVNPDQIILLGSQPLECLGMKKSTYRDLVGKKEIEVEGKPTIVAPFITGQGRTQKGFFEKYNSIKQLLTKF